MSHGVPARFRHLEDHGTIVQCPHASHWIAGVAAPCEVPGISGRNLEVLNVNRAGVLVFRAPFNRHLSGLRGVRQLSPGKGGTDLDRTSPNLRAREQKANGFGVRCCPLGSSFPAIRHGDHNATREFEFCSLRRC